MIVLPIILLNSVSAAVAALSLMDLGPEAYLSMSIATTVFNLFAAILVAIQKFFQYEEKVIGFSMLESIAGEMDEAAASPHVEPGCPA